MNQLTVSGYLTFLGICFHMLQFAGSAGLPCKQPSLEWHNYYRRIHQVANVTWSDNLWLQAKTWAEYLAKENKFQHDPKQPGNLFLSPGQPIDPCATAVKYFYMEEKYYNYSNPHFSLRTGHFTQVVWKSTKQIGAVSKRRKDGKTVVVVRYHPPGNFGGYFDTNVFPPRRVDTTTHPLSVTVTNSINNTTAMNFTTWENTTTTWENTTTRRVDVIADGSTLKPLKKMLSVLIWLSVEIMAY
ncbi:PREDICTED: Golgi-associated plant pathogenesis-related protein 1-like isoform X2 [Acropora digitifera]|uniref:Golgi-associated plant pathogenesis-related protein 1-like isoform X2 n=1 Tax=Acropora digitifera TaxID=70779 RepID=UPI00077ACF27|nr:PREDICTED: Golgi-associated plant pathogenesis-related protein 1-like isoform X2 [Acropora digitifera]